MKIRRNVLRGLARETTVRVGGFVVSSMMIVWSYVSE